MAKKMSISVLDLLTKIPASDVEIDPSEINLDLLKKFDRNGPRYTSYPTADRFVEAFNAETYSVQAKKRNIGGINRPLSIYAHIPFCNTLCFYCACNKIITKNRAPAEKYLHYLQRELVMQAALFQDQLLVEQLHLGGGTPTFFSDQQLRTLMESVQRNFILVPNGEYSIEIDPRSVADSTIPALRAMGFNRLSIGVQDFDQDVQQAVHRIQSEEETLKVIHTARREGFKSISIDLIYGLPKQTAEKFSLTLDKIIDANPDRISLFNYAHLPHLFKPQRRIQDQDLPTPEIKLEILRMAIKKLTRANYVYIGMDHFAKANDELTIAQQQGRLHRNFQGYSAHANCDLIGLGVSAIGNIGAAYSQNYRTLEEYYDHLDHGTLPIMRGLVLNMEDLLRRTIIQSLMCHFELSTDAIETAYPIDFKNHFAAELTELQEHARAGLLTIKDGWITITPKGRLLIRSICMVFDQYLHTDKAREQQRYSKVI